VQLVSDTKNAERDTKKIVSQIDMFTKLFTSRSMFTTASTLVLLCTITASCLADSIPQASANYPENAEAAEKRSWNNLQGSWGKRTSNQELLAELSRENMVLNDLLDAVRYGDEEEDELYRPVGQKRAWKNMNGAWGKRVGGDWNKFRGSWGKREPGWNNLKGLWGKRDSWNKLQSAWGKRSDISQENF